MTNDQFISLKKRIYQKAINTKSLLGYAIYLLVLIILPALISYIPFPMYLTHYVPKNIISYSLCIIYFIIYKYAKLLTYIHFKIPLYLVNLKNYLLYYKNKSTYLTIDLLKKQVSRRLNLISLFISIALCSAGIIYAILFIFSIETNKITDGTVQAELYSYFQSTFGSQLLLITMIPVALLLIYYLANYAVQATIDSQESRIKD